MEYKIAKDIAVEICYRLEPYCDLIKIAGGLRRHKPDPHDIELVIIPKKETIKTDLFGGSKDIRSEEFISVVKKLGEIIKGQPTGKMMQIELPEKIMLDLFMPDDFDFYRIYAVRTGSAEYTKRYVSGAWVKNGWVGSDKGLRKREDCKAKPLKDGKTFWECINPLAEIPPVWVSEEHFFKWVNTQWIHPQQRNL